MNVLSQDPVWINVNSSFIQEASLCEQSRIIAFRIKGDELFFEISNPRIDIKSLFLSFLKSDSKGRFFNKVFRKNRSLT